MAALSAVSDTTRPSECCLSGMTYSKPAKSVLTSMISWIEYDTTVDRALPEHEEYLDVEQVLSRA